MILETPSWWLHPLLTLDIFIQNTQISMQNYSRIFFSLYIYISQSQPSLPLFSVAQESHKQQNMAPSLCFRTFILQFMLLVFSILNTSLQASEPQLTLDYYASACPNLFDIVKKEMECAVLSDPRNAALIVRLHFHDCFVQVHNVIY